MNKPVPIAPPSESIIRWRVVIARFKEGESPLAEVCVESEGVDIQKLRFEKDILYFHCVKIHIYRYFQIKAESRFIK